MVMVEIYCPTTISQHSHNWVTSSHFGKNKKQHSLKKKCCDYNWLKFQFWLLLLLHRTVKAKAVSLEWCGGGTDVVECWCAPVCPPDPCCQHGYHCHLVLTRPFGSSRPLCLFCSLVNIQFSFQIPLFRFPPCSTQGTFQSGGLWRYCPRSRIFKAIRVSTALWTGVGWGVRREGGRGPFGSPLQWQLLHPL